jgi:3-dehydroquinate dehydratase/shikimate dehydrogenase
LRVLELLKDSPKPTVALCMGDLGMPSRLLGAVYGAPFTYAAFNKERGIAPGLPSYDELARVYHYERINSQTQVYGVIGDPVGHSLSPLIHNAAFREMEINAVYLPFRVPRGELASFLKDFERFRVRGYSVTIPHKEAAAAVAKHKDFAVELTQAANTLILTDGWSAYNTDFQAALDSLRAGLPADPQGQPATLQSKAVLILGAGGVARAVAHAAHREGAVVTLVNRTAERAQKLAGEVSCRHAEWGGRHTLLCDILINCTSVGMHPNVDECPIHFSFLKPGMVVMDTIYTPEHTLLIKKAKERGCHVLTGVDMFVRQAALQFRLFTGVEPPLDLMRSVVKRALSPVTIREEA